MAKKRRRPKEQRLAVNGQPPEKKEDRSRKATLSQSTGEYNPLSMQIQQRGNELFGNALHDAFGWKVSKMAAKWMGRGIVMLLILLAGLVAVKYLGEGILKALADLLRVIRTFGNPPN